MTSLNLGGKSASTIPGPKKGTGGTLFSRGMNKGKKPEEIVLFPGLKSETGGTLIAAKEDQR